MKFESIMKGLRFFSGANIQVYRLWRWLLAYSILGRRKNIFRKIFFGIFVFSFFFIGCDASGLSPEKENAKYDKQLNIINISNEYLGWYIDLELEDDSDTFDENAGLYMPGSEDVKLTSSVISTNLLNSNDKPITGSNRLYYVYLYFINDGNEDVGWVSKNKVIIGSQPLVLDFTKDFKVDE